MKNVFAYVCAPNDTLYEVLAQYCQELYRMGYTPISPTLMFAPYMKDSDPIQREDKKRMAHSLLRRCRVLVLCSNAVSRDMEVDMLLAKRWNIVSTTLAGIKQISSRIHVEGV